MNGSELQHCTLEPVQDGTLAELLGAAHQGHYMWSKARTSTELVAVHAVVDQASSTIEFKKDAVRSSADAASQQ